MNADVFIKQIAKKAGDATWKRFGKDGALYMKSEYAYDVVTKADLMADRMIVGAIKKTFPTHGINAEESGKVREDAEYVWHIDPIDGTKNFSRHIPLFGTMIALSRNNTVILAAVYIPANKELFFAKAGKGAYLNGKKIHCSTKRDLKKSEGLCQLQFMSKNIAFIKNIFKQPGIEHFAVGTYGAFALNGTYVAAGRKDWVFAPYGQVHDYAAPSLILKESGCTVTGLDGKEWKLGRGGIVAANPVLHRQLMKLVKGV